MQSFPPHGAYPPAMFYPQPPVVPANAQHGAFHQYGYGMPHNYSQPLSQILVDSPPTKSQPNITLSDLKKQLLEMEAERQAQEKAVKQPKVIRLRPHMRILPKKESNGAAFYPVVDALNNGVRYVMCGHCKNERLYQSLDGIKRHLRQCPIFLQSCKDSNEATIKDGGSKSTYQRSMTSYIEAFSTTDATSFSSPVSDQNHINQAIDQLQCSQTFFQPASVTQKVAISTQNEELKKDFVSDIESHPIQPVEQKSSDSFSAVKFLEPIPTPFSQEVVPGGLSSSNHSIVDQTLFSKESNEADRWITRKSSQKEIRPQTNYRLGHECSQETPIIRGSRPFIRNISHHLALGECLNDGNPFPESFAASLEPPTQCKSQMGQPMGSQSKNLIGFEEHSKLLLATSPRDMRTSNSLAEQSTQLPADINSWVIDHTQISGMDYGFSSISDKKRESQTPYDLEPRMLEIPEEFHYSENSYRGELIDDFMVEEIEQLLNEGFPTERLSNEIEPLQAPECKVTSLDFGPRFNGSSFYNIGNKNSPQAEAAAVADLKILEQPVSCVAETAPIGMNKKPRKKRKTKDKKPVDAISQTATIVKVVTHLGVQTDQSFMHNERKQRPHSIVSRRKKRSTTFSKKIKNNQQVETEVRANAWRSETARASVNQRSLSRRLKNNQKVESNFSTNAWLIESANASLDQRITDETIHDIHSQQELKIFRRRAYPTSFSCGLCQSDEGHDTEFVLCEACGMVSHLSCQRGPPFTKLPSADWVCSTCSDRGFIYDAEYQPGEIAWIWYNSNLWPCLVLYADWDMSCRNPELLYLIIYLGTTDLELCYSNIIKRWEKGWQMYMKLSDTVKRSNPEKVAGVEIALMFQGQQWIDLKCFGLKELLKSRRSVFQETLAENEAAAIKHQDKKQCIDDNVTETSSRRVTSWNRKPAVRVPIKDTQNQNMKRHKITNSDGTKQQSIKRNNSANVAHGSARESFSPPKRFCGNPALPLVIPSSLQLRKILVSNDAPMPVRSNFDPASNSNCDLFDDHGLKSQVVRPITSTAKCIDSKMEKRKFGLLKKRKCSGREKVSQNTSRSNADESRDFSPIGVNSRSIVLNSTTQTLLRPKRQSARHSATNEVRRQIAENPIQLVGRRIKIRWMTDRSWHPGLVQSYYRGNGEAIQESIDSVCVTGQYKVQYDSGITSMVDLSRCQLLLL